MKNKVYTLSLLKNLNLDSIMNKMRCIVDKLWVL